MAKLTLNTIGSRYGSIDALNDNFNAIEAAIENTLSLDGTSPNAMEVDLDMNSQDILNVGEVSAETLRINGVLVEPTTGITAGAAFQTYEYTATAGQTSFSVAPATPYNASIVVIVNGLQLSPTEVSVSGTSVLTPALTLNDEVVIRRYTAEPLAAPDASEVNFIQAGTGAITTNVQTKLREQVSFEDFGAIGNGVANDTIAVQAALNASRMVYGSPGKNYLVGPISLPNDTTLDLGSATLTALGPILSTSQMILVGDRCTIKNGKINSSNTNGATTVNADGAYYTILFENKTGLRVEGVEFTNYRYAVVMSTRTGLNCTDMLVQGCIFNGTVWPIALPDSLPYCVFVGNTTNVTNTTIGTFTTNWAEALLVSGVRIIGNRMVGGQYGVALQRCSSVTVQGNTIVDASRGISVQHQCRDITISGNNVGNCHSTGIHLAYGCRNIAITGNTITGTMSNDNTGIQAYYGCQDVVIADNVMDTEFDQWAGGVHLETVSPQTGFGIRIGQMTKNVRITGNQLRGYSTGIAALSTVYPTVITGADPNYQKAGVKSIEITDNKIVFDYAVAVTTGYQGQNLASNSYGVLVGKAGGWESNASGAWGLDDVSVEGNKFYDTQYALVWQYVADTSGSPAAKTKLIARRNISVSTIGTNADVYSGGITGVDIYSRDNSWTDSNYQDWITYTPTVAGLGGAGSVVLTGKYLKRGNTIWAHIYVVCTGAVSGSAAAAFTVAGYSGAEGGTCWAANATTGASYGTGVTNTTSSPIVSPTWSVTSQTVLITAMFRV